MRLNVEKNTIVALESKGVAAHVGVEDIFEIIKVVRWFKHLD